ncbi:copper resistance protein NlpE N-terminal domain-containing protein [Rhodocyclaceae bacterium SMB388]
MLVLLTTVLVACSTEKPIAQAAAPAAQRAPVVDIHTSRTALDWAGLYEGMLGCADCAGVHALLTLDKDASFELVKWPLVRGAAPSTERGRFSWQPDGNSIVLDTVAGELRFAVGEGRLMLRSIAGVRQVPGAPNTVLTQMPAGQRGDRPTVVDVLTDHSWALIDATDASNRRVDALFPDPERAFSFGFAESRLHVRGGCNGFRGAFAIGDDDMLSVTGMMSTLMACDTPLMEADSALSALMAEPLEVALIRGAQPTLVLLAATGEVLLLAGELTPEARYGAPTTVFLEIAAQPVSCDRAIRADGVCLQVRERRYDERGLIVGEPGEWQTFAADIEGYRHENGIRNVLRVKQFQPATEGGVVPEPVFVLDLVVESEVVPQ